MNVDNPKSIEYYSILRQAFFIFLSSLEASVRPFVDSRLKAWSDNNGYMVRSLLFFVELLVALLLLSKMIFIWLADGNT